MERIGDDRDWIKYYVPLMHDIMCHAFSEAHAY